MNHYHQLVVVNITLKKVVKMCESVLTSRTKARKVEKPPFQTAGPIRVSVTLARAEIAFDKNSFVHHYNLGGRLDFANIVNHWCRRTRNASASLIASHHINGKS